MRTSTEARVRLEAGERIPARVLETIEHTKVAIPAPDGAWVHLQFRRYAGCPICNLHLRSIVRRHEEILGANVREVVVFHSAEAELRRMPRLPFAVIADPDRRLYAEFGVVSSMAAVFDPRVWPTAIRALATSASADPAAGRESGYFGLPADFLISGDGRLAAVKYGVNADDQWSVDELVDRTRDARLGRSSTV